MCVRCAWFGFTKLEGNASFVGLNWKESTKEAVTNEVLPYPLEVQFKLEITVGTSQSLEANSLEVYGTGWMGLLSSLNNYWKVV